MLSADNSPARVLDGLHFPHVLDAVLDLVPPETLAAVSQVCSQWRLHIKHMFYHLTVFEEERKPRVPIFRLSTGRTFQATTLLDQAAVLLYHCRILDSEPPKFARCINSSALLDHAFPSLQVSRVSDYWNDSRLLCGIRITHHAHPPTPGNACPCCHWSSDHSETYTFYGQGVGKFVLTTWGHDAMFDTRLPFKFQSMAIIFMFESAHPECPGDVEVFWETFSRAVIETWRIKRTVVVVNAESLNNRPLWLRDLSGCEVEEKLRLLALEGVYYEIMMGLSEFEEASQEPIDSANGDFDLEGSETDRELGTSDSVDVEATTEADAPDSAGLTRAEWDSSMRDLPPGPVCPVHFLSLEAYRALVGEHQFAIDTCRGWMREPVMTE